jgi:glycosyltransferase involved in cell wall biosynthesis
MKILMLAEPRSAHTLKWVRALAEKDISILLFSLFRYKGNEYDGQKNIQLECLNLKPALFYKSEGNVEKILFLKAVPYLKKLIKTYKPDLLHAHYATSYGTLGALTGFHPYIISVWGTDVFNFPQISWLHKQILKYNFFKADRILSTSQIMARQTAKYTRKKIDITPFGIDLNVFKPDRKLKADSSIYIGIVKSLENKYGIDYLIKAFKIIVDKHSQLSVRLLIVGGGSQETKLKNLTEQLQISNKTIFTGLVKYDEVVSYHNKLTITVFPSLEESFGVAVLEASACEKPVIVSNVGGLPEVVLNGETGIIVEPKDPEKLAVEIEKLLLNEDLRTEMGKKGREFVKAHYNLPDNVERMLSIYYEILETP